METRNIIDAIEDTGCRTEGRRPTITDDEMLETNWGETQGYVGSSGRNIDIDQRRITAYVRRWWPISHRNPTALGKSEWAVRAMGKCESWRDDSILDGSALKD